MLSLAGGRVPAPAHSPWGTAGTLLCTTALGTRLHPRLHSLQLFGDTQPSGLCSYAAAPKLEQDFFLDKETQIVCILICSGLSQI